MLVAAPMRAWLEHERYGTYPRAGGWEDQPLALLSHLEALDLVGMTARYLAREDADWNKLSPLQLELKVWLES